MDGKNLQVLPLHKHPQYLKSCCDLINDEWPRSETARMMSLTASCDDLPTSLILVNNEKQLLGHCKLTPIPSKPQSCFIETVVINKSMRGQKLGSYLMNYVEKYCREILCLQMVHLSTKGQENFYAKLGYEVCPPVSIYGVRVPSNFKSTQVQIKADNPSAVVQPDTGPPPPPPPPMPSHTFSNTTTNQCTSKTYMCKYL